MALVKQQEAKLQAAKHTLASVGERVLTSSKTVPNQYSAERLQTMLAELQNQRTALLTKYRTDDRRVKEVDQQIADTGATLNLVRQGSSLERTTDANPVHTDLERDTASTELDLEGTRGGQAELAGKWRNAKHGCWLWTASMREYDDLVRCRKSAEDMELLYRVKRLPGSAPLAAFRLGGAQHGVTGLILALLAAGQSSLSKKEIKDRLMRLIAILALFLCGYTVFAKADEQLAKRDARYHLRASDSVQITYELAASLTRPWLFNPMASSACI